MSRPGRLGIGLIGSGNVGPILAAAFAGAGHALVGMTESSDRDRAGAILPEVPVLSVAEVIRRSELVLVAVPHDQLPGLVSGIAQTDRWRPGQLVLHTDPGYGVDVLEPALLQGAIPLALHPAISFTGTSLDLRMLAGAYAAVTAAAPVLPIAQALAVELGCEPVVVAEADRPRYAEAIATATVFSTEIIRQAAAGLREVGIANPGSYLSALTRSALERALTEAGRGDDAEALAAQLAEAAELGGEGEFDGDDDD